MRLRTLKEQVSYNTRIGIITILNSIIYATQRYLIERLMIIPDENDKCCYLANLAYKHKKDLIKNTQNNENHLAEIRSWV